MFYITEKNFKEFGGENFDNVKENLSKFIDFTFVNNPSKIQHFTYYGNWHSFNKSWLEVYSKNNNIYLIRYEDLLSDTKSTMVKLLTEFFEIKNLNEKKIKHYNTQIFV